MKCYDSVTDWFHGILWDISPFILLTGGMVSKPLEKAENDVIQEIGNKFYNTCEANEQSGKTLWIGIERSKEKKWVVRFLFISYFHWKI